MIYGKMVQGQFIRKVNRFIAEVYIKGVKEEVHIKNTGRLTELLRTGAEVLLEYSNNPNRKTKFSLISVKKEGRLVNIDSQAPNLVVFEALKTESLSEFNHIKSVKREVTYGDSRFDLYYENERGKGFIEVKGVTLERNGMALFPDAPTTRGTKHVLELAKAVQDGYSCTILFVIQMKGCTAFAPNKEVDPLFTDALIQASAQGVRILAYDTIVRDNELILNQPVSVQL
ncbi:DNA/RNA nuclease SfsA [Niallia sp. Krafla_26]|uniref:DNA/RNA nuclease SfsA n=1 Tax=Niallia sp. Krafla_26 TaxID=3064703 RepID=UPI003D17D465